MADDDHRPASTEIDPKNNRSRTSAQKMELRVGAHEGDLLGTDVILRNNRFEDCGTGKQKIGVRISADAQGTIIEGNAYTGMVEDIVQQQLAAAAQ